VERIDKLRKNIEIKETLSENKLFDSLTRSAFEFLSRAIAEFENSAKFSTIHFAIAIELFLKARLMCEHWSLLLDKPDHSSKESFFKGDAKTVSPDQAIERLRRIAQVIVPEPFKEIFRKIAEHRNKMVHFIHAGEDEADGLDGRQRIVEEQCAGWLALRTLLAEWPEFSGYKTDIWRISVSMERYRPYLQKAFEAKADELRRHRAQGGRVIECPSCRFASVMVSESDDAVADANCTVCRFFHGAEIKVKCENNNCDEVIHFTSYEGRPSQCPSCDTVLSEKYVRDFLDTGEEITHDNYFDFMPISCSSCTGYHAVVKHHDRYVCTECFETAESYSVCDYCNEAQLGSVPEDSGWSGCEFCDGRAGNISDD